jgi:hypothetical protein
LTGDNISGALARGNDHEDFNMESLNDKNAFGMSKEQFRRRQPIPQRPGLGKPIELDQRKPAWAIKQLKASGR